MELPLQLKAYAARVEPALEQLLPPVDRSPAKLGEAIRYSCLAPGKRLRPALVLAAAEAVGGTIESALPGACAVEMVHAFSLIHDDLPAIDNDDLRRGRPTCHVKFGEAIAILAGDGLFSMAFAALAASGATPERALRCVRILSEASNCLVFGEALDILSEGTPVDIATLNEIHRNKTAELIAASCEIGAVLGGADDAQVAALREYGLKIGLAFQIVDDILNETSTPEKLGKSAGSDRERAKATYPAIFGLEASGHAAVLAAEEGIAALDAIPKKEVLVELARYAIDRLH